MDRRKEFEEESDNLDAAEVLVYDRRDFRSVFSGYYGIFKREYPDFTIYDWYILDCAEVGYSYLLVCEGVD